MYKIGLLYCKEGQSLEEEMYKNGEYVCMCVCPICMCVCPDSCTTLDIIIGWSMVSLYII